MCSHFKVYCHFYKKCSAYTQYSFYSYGSILGHHLLPWSQIDVCACDSKWVCVVCVGAWLWVSERMCFISCWPLFERSRDESLDKHKGMSTKDLSQQKEPWLCQGSLWERYALRHHTGLLLHTAPLHQTPPARQKYTRHGNNNVLRYSQIHDLRGEWELWDCKGMKERVQTLYYYTT